MSCAAIVLLAAIAVAPRLVVDIEAANRDEAWVAAAFEEKAALELDAAALELDPAACPGRDAACLYDAYVAAGAEVIVLGTIDARGLALEVYVASSKLSVARELIPLAGETGATISDRLRKIVRPAFVPRPPPADHSTRWWLALLGGALWAAFLLSVLRLALPAMPGLSSIRHGNLGRMLRAWLVSALQRSLLLAVFYSPLLLIPSEGRLLLVPLTGLVIHFGMLFAVDRLSSAVDARFVVGRARAENIWHPIIKKYFIGYVRREGLQLDRSLLDRTLFLPGKVPGDGVISYGGGFAPARIVIDVGLLETALHALPEERLFDQEDDQRESLDLGDPGGVLLPGEERIERKITAAADALRRRVMSLQGQNETLLGYIQPIPLEESAPLVIDDRDEYSVLRRLLTAHYAAFDRRSYGEEADDTDPTHKDFLFGAILRELGGIYRRDSLFHALALNFPRRLYLRSPEIIADGYAALNRGLHPLIQYLDHVRTKSDALLTARADEPAFVSTSMEILRRVLAEEPRPGDRAQRRLRALAEHLQADVPTERRSLKLAIYAVLTLAIVGGVFAAIKQSFDYHQVYQDRIHEQKGERADGR